MKKSNWILLTVFLIASIFLLWLWYYLGFNRVDNPLDLVLSIIWWVVIVVSFVVISRAEKKRREEIRTIYVGSDAIFNVERGLISVSDPTVRLDEMGQLLDGLEYGFHKEDWPGEDVFEPDFVVRSEDFDENGAPGGGDSEDREPKWKGTVTKIDHVNGNTKVDFDGVAQLAGALS